MSSSDSRHADQTRTYNRASSVVFLKTDAPFGGLSNMAGGYPLRVNGIRILTSEALYQACRFPHRPEVQTLIIGQKSPMTAKMKSKPYRHDSRPDWDQVRVKIMRWCLRVKLAQNWRAFSELLLATGERPIVEESRKDDFWGAKATDDGTLVGMNVLGRLLMELREAVKADGRELLMRVQPLAIPDFLLGGRQIEAVGSQADERDVESGTAAVAHPGGEPKGLAVNQPSLFDAPAVMEAPPAAYFAVSPKGVHVADLKPYAEYKKSGSKWLGAVPVTWEVRNLRTLISKRAERDRADLPLLSVAREKGVFVRSLTDADENHNVIPEDLSNYKVARAGNLVINKMKAWQGSMGIAPCDGIVSPAYFVFDFRIANHAFGQKLLRSKPYVAHFGQASDGVRVGQWDLSIPGMRQIPVLVPPPDEQAAIVRFLDWANGRLERAMRAKRKVIALLNEQKQAIIHRAVTRGLDSSVSLKPSGIPWLGDIPQHWEVRRAKYLFREVDERSAGGSEELLSVSHLTGVTPRSQKSITMFKAASYAGHKLCRPGDLVVNTMWAWMGALGVSTYSGIISPAYAVYRPRHPNSIVGVYMDGLLRSRPYVSNIICRSTGLRLSRLRLYPEEFFRLPIIQPPVEEQQRIVERIRSDTTELDTAISRLEREIDLLREYRTRLVADVVTGKLDARDAAARLPVETPIDMADDDADPDDETETADEEAAA